MRMTCNMWAKVGRAEGSLAQHCLISAAQLRYNMDIGKV